MTKLGLFIDFGDKYKQKKRKKCLLGTKFFIFDENFSLLIIRQITRKVRELSIFKQTFSLK